MKRYTIKELSYKGRAKYPYAVLENNRVIRRFHTLREARKYRVAMNYMFGGK